VPPDVIEVFNTGVAGARYFKNMLACVHCGRLMDASSVWTPKNPLRGIPRGERRAVHTLCRGTSYLEH